MHLKQVIFHAKAIEEFRDLPKTIRISFGESLRLLQEGISLGMPASRPMSIVAPGVCELRAKDSSGQYRAFYLRNPMAGILVLRAFHKKSESTPLAEIRLARRRLREMNDDNT